MRPTWSNALLLLAVSLVALVAIYWGTSASIVSMWAKDPLGHGYLVLPAALYLAWVRRDSLVGLTLRPAFWWLPVLAVVSAAWLLASLASMTGVQQLCVGIMFVGFVWGTLGTAAARELAFPLGFLIFALPFGDYLVPSLQRLTAGFAVWLLQMSGVPVLLRSEVISIPGSTWEVASACSGINYLMSALVMAYLYAGIVYRSKLYRLGLVLVAAPIALFANGLRVYLTILVASAGAPEFSSGMRHYAVGWLLFALILSATIAVSHVVKERTADTVDDVRGSASARTRYPVPEWSTAAFVLIGLAIVGVAPLSASRLLDGNRGEPIVTPGLEVSLPWQPMRRDVYQWAPHTATASAVVSETYAGGARPVKLHIAYYAPHGRDGEVGSRGNRLSGNGWVAGDTVVTGATVDGRPVRVDETVLQSSNATILVWHWYRIEETQTSSPFLAKFRLIESRLKRSDRLPASIAVATEEHYSGDGRAVLQDFLTHARLDSRGHQP